MTEGENRNPDFDPSRVNLVPEPIPTKVFKTSGEMARSLGFVFDKKHSAPIDQVHSKPITVSEGSGIEELLVDTGRYEPEQGFSIGSSLGTSAWSKAKTLLGNGYFTPQDLERLGLGSQISNLRLPFDFLRSGGYNRVAAAIRELEARGVFEEQLKDLLAENSFGHKLIPNIVAKFQERLPGYSRVVDKYDANKHLYLVSEPPPGKKSLPVLDIAVRANGITVIPTVMRPAEDPSAIIDPEKFKRYEDAPSWETRYEERYKLGSIKTAHQVLDRAVNATFDFLAPKGKS